MKPMTRRRSLDRSILERLLLGRGVEKIAQECAVGKRRVREVREKAIAHGYLDLKGKGAGPTVAPLPPHPLFPDPVDGRSLRTSPQDEVLTERLEWIKDRLKAGWSPITVFEEIGDPSVGRSSFYRFLSRHSLHDMGKHYRSPTLITPIIHTPGEALILDWGKIRDVMTLRAVDAAFSGDSWAYSDIPVTSWSAWSGRTTCRRRWLRSRACFRSWAGCLDDLPATTRNALHLKPMNTIRC